MALEGMTAKNAFIVVLCCLILSGMHSLVPLLFNMAAQQGRELTFAAGSVFILHRVHLHSKFLDSLGLSPSSLSSHPLLKVGPKLQTTNSPAPCPADWPHHLPQSCPIWVKGNLPLLYSGLPVKFPAPQIQEPNI